MNEPKLTAQSEAIIAKLRDELKHTHLSEDELKQVRRGLALVDSYGIFTRFIIGLAATVAALSVLGSYLWPGGGK